MGIIQAADPSSPEWLLPFFRVLVAHWAPAMSPPAVASECLPWAGHWHWRPQFQKRLMPCHSQVELSRPGRSTSVLPWGTNRWAAGRQCRGPPWPPWQWKQCSCNIDSLLSLEHHEAMRLGDQFQCFKFVRFMGKVQHQSCYLPNGFNVILTSLIATKKN